MLMMFNAAWLRGAADASQTSCLTLFKAPAEAVCCSTSCCVMAHWNLPSHRNGEKQGIVESWGGAFGSPDLSAAGTKGRDRCTASLGTRPTRDTVVGQRWYRQLQLIRGRDGNAESVKLHESPGEGKRRGESGEDVQYMELTVHPVSPQLSSSDFARL